MSKYNYFILLLLKNFKRSQGAVATLWLRQWIQILTSLVCLVEIAWSAVLKILKCGLAMLMWTIWNFMNKHYFENIRLQQILDMAQILLQDYKKANRISLPMSRSSSLLLEVKRISPYLCIF